MKLHSIIKIDTIFMNSKNSQMSKPHYTWKNIKSSYNNNRFKISAPTQNDKFELPDGSYSVSDIQDYLNTS